MEAEDIYTEKILDMLLSGSIEPKIGVVGCGGCGNNIVNNLYGFGLDGVELIAINTDHPKLMKINADKKVLLGTKVTRGHGAGGFPEVAKFCVEQSQGALLEVLDGLDIAFVIAGMGAGTGQGAAPVIAMILQDRGTVVVGIAVMPFEIEGRAEKAKEGLKELRKYTHSFIVLDNNRLTKFTTMDIDKVFAIMDRSIMSTIQSMSQQLSKSYLPGLVRDAAEIANQINKVSKVEIDEVKEKEDEKKEVEIDIADKEKILVVQ